MAIRERSLKYLDAQQVNQQISIFFKSIFHNEGGVCEKKNSICKTIHRPEKMYTTSSGNSGDTYQLYLIPFNDEGVDGKLFPQTSETEKITEISQSALFSSI